MKKSSILWLFVLLIGTFNQSFAQDFLPQCPIEIEVIADRYMRGKAFVDKKKVKHMKVVFTASAVKVWLPYEDKSILLEIENSNCHAYCPRIKRIRQLHSGDERLLRRLIARQKKKLFRQLQKCGF